MSTVHKISEDFFYEEEYELIAIHSSIEDYAMAYLLNKYLKSKLSRNNNDLDISEKVSFPIFEWKDTVNDKYWTLITNTSIKEEDNKQVGLFNNELAYTVHYLVPEYKEVDYFLKIEQDIEIQSVVKEILSAPEIVTAYSIETSKLKSKNNLIF